jgi:hypothetical protein
MAGPLLNLWLASSMGYRYLTSLLLLLLFSGSLMIGSEDSEIISGTKKSIEVLSTIAFIVLFTIIICYYNLLLSLSLLLLLLFKLFINSISRQQYDMPHQLLSSEEVNNNNR